MEIESQKEEWKYFTRVRGELCVTIPGIWGTQLLFVANWDILQH